MPTNSSAFVCAENKKQMEYYTYAYLREDRTPYYIGKGQGNRAYRRNKKCIKPPKDKSRIIYLKQNLTEEEAFKHEIYMIDVLGRKDNGTGILRNLTDGGDGISGLIITDKHKKKLSEAMKGNTNCLGRIISEEHRRKLIEANKGKTHSEETKRKLSESLKGKTHSEETKKKLSEANKGRITSEETKRKQSEANKGKTRSEEHKRKMSEARKGNTNWLGKTHSEESKRKMSEVKQGIKWWNDGCGNRKFVIECPGNGWRLGKK